MKIQTKLSLKDKGFIIVDRKIIQATVLRIKIDIQANNQGKVGMAIQYSCRYKHAGGHTFDTVHEGQIFKTKQELIDSL